MTDETIKLPEPAQPRVYFCNKCGHFGEVGPSHAGCDYYATDSGPFFTADQVRAAVLEAKRDLPPLLFDGYYVWEEGLTDAAKKRTSPENVADVLDAVVRLMRAAAIRSGHSITETKRAEE